MSASDVVIESAKAAASIVDTDEFISHTNHTLDLMGRTLIDCVNEADQPGLLSPVQVEVGGRERNGAILVLEDRSVVVWFTGSLRTKRFQATIPLLTITGLEALPRSGTSGMGDPGVLRIQADKPWTLIFADVFRQGHSIVPHLAPKLLGVEPPGPAG